jgi:HK97 family phage portal protein
MPEPEARLTIPPSMLMGSGDDAFADVRVSTTTDAMRGIAVHSAVDLFAGITSELPVGVFSGCGDDRRARPVPWWFEDPSGDGHGLEDFLYQLMVAWLLRGNLYGQKLATLSSGVPIQIDLWDPDRVTVRMVDGEPVWALDGREVDQKKFVHRRVNPTPGQLLGMSVVTHHATQIAISQSATKYGLAYFRQGVHPSGVLTNDQLDLRTLDDDAVKLIKGRFMAGLRGTREPALLGRGWSWQKLTVTPEESQFLATSGASEAQCCRMFGAGVAETLGYPSGGTLTYINVESRAQHLLVFSLGRWLRRAERFLTSMLPDSQYVELDREAILETTTLARYQAHASALQNRWKVVNEVRRTEGLPAVPCGDEPASGGSGSGSDSGANGSEAPQQGGTE